MSSRSRPTVSVVIPCFNQGHFLDEAVTSCLEAYDGPLEIIVVNDGSTDRATAKHIRDLDKLPINNLVVLNQANGGLANARNNGVRRASSDFVQLLDADDLLVRNKISLQVDQFAVAHSLDVSITDYYVCDGTRTDFEAPPSSIAPFELTESDMLFRWERGLSIPIHTGLFRSRLFADRAPFIESQRAKEDWVFWVGLALARIRFGYLPLRLAAYRVHGNNMTRSWSAMGLEWLKAARQIETWLDGRHPDFMPRSLAWHRDFYLARAESQQARAEPTDASPTASASKSAEPRIGVQPTAEQLACATPKVIEAATPTKPKISVVIPVYNHARYLESCIDSASQQTFAPIEILCVDDASPDPSVRPILEEIAARTPMVRLILLAENAGIAAAQNAALEAVSGDYVAFLDCDDRLDPRALETIAAAIARNPTADYFFTDRTDIDAEGSVKGVVRYGGYPARFGFDGVSHYDNLLNGMIASHLKVLRLTSIRQAGGFDPDTSGVQDWALALEVANRDNLVYVAQPLYYHRIHPGSVTLSQRVRMFRLTNEVRRRHQGKRHSREIDTPLAAAMRQGVTELLAANPRPGQKWQDFHWLEGVRGWRHQTTGTMVVRDARSFRQAYADWEAATATVFALRDDAPAMAIGFLREFNSYFDLVVCANGAQWAALHRYMWNAAALRMTEDVAATIALTSATGPDTTSRCS